MPKDGTYFWGFCGETHKVMLCYKVRGYDIGVVDTSLGVVDAFIVAWAEIEAPAMPDFGELERCESLDPPIESREWAERMLAFWQRENLRRSPPQSEAEARLRERPIKAFQAKIDVLTKDFVVENGYHMPPESKRDFLRPAAIVIDCCNPSNEKL